jgi:AraC family transcriptional regulator
VPAYVPVSSTWDQEASFLHCYLDPFFLTHCAHETINPDRVEVKLTLEQPDPLIWQICLALKTVLETDASNSQFYAESMATALASHLLRFYATRKHEFKEYNDGIPLYRLRKVNDFMRSHLAENLSLADIAHELGMSQFYFCRLFKQTTGTTPHQYLIQLRVERAKHLLKNTKLTINEIADECGFASPSHLARHLRKDTGLSPKQFRMS